MCVVFSAALSQFCVEEIDFFWLFDYFSKHFFKLFGLSTTFKFWIPNSAQRSSSTTIDDKPVKQTTEKLSVARSKYEKVVNEIFYCVKIVLSNFEP